MGQAAGLAIKAQIGLCQRRSVRKTAGNCGKHRRRETSAGVDPVNDDGSGFRLDEVKGLEIPMAKASGAGQSLGPPVMQGSNVGVKGAAWSLRSSRDCNGSRPGTEQACTRRCTATSSARQTSARRGCSRSGIPRVGPGQYSMTMVWRSPKAPTAKTSGTGNPYPGAA